jgi:hypothetical protein
VSHFGGRFRQPPPCCWYCDTEMLVRRGTPDNRASVRTREHLVALVDGGDDLPDNLREACRRCNNFVNDWSVERKLRFRVLLLSVGGWPGLRSRFGPKLGRRNRVERALDAMEPPDDPESQRARAAAVRVELRRLLHAWVVGRRVEVLPRGKPLVLLRRGAFVENRG